MKYDDASWHSGGEFPESSPEEYGGTHIGLYLRWCFIQGWAGALHLGAEAQAVQKVISGSLTGTQFLFRFCDGKLTDKDLNEAGNTFTAKYYGDNGLYLGDYVDLFHDKMYVHSESDHDFSTLDRRIKERKETGRLTEDDQ